MISLLCKCDLWVLFTHKTFLLPHTLTVTQPNGFNLVKDQLVTTAAIPDNKGLLNPYFWPAQASNLKYLLGKECGVVLLCRIVWLISAHFQQFPCQRSFGKLCGVLLGFFPALKEAESRKIIVNCCCHLQRIVTRCTSQASSCRTNLCNVS